MTRFERVSTAGRRHRGTAPHRGLALTWDDPSSETGLDETLPYWADNRGQHQISGLLPAPLIAFLLVFFGAGLKWHFKHDVVGSMLARQRETPQSAALSRG